MSLLSNSVSRLLWRTVPLRKNYPVVRARHHYCHTVTGPPHHEALNIKHFSRFSANLIMTGTDTIRISDYDIVGFDLDNTLVRYKITAMVQLQYKALASHLVAHCGYSGDVLLRPLDEQLDFLQRGLIIDLRRGNVLKVSADGYIRRAAHGTRFLDDAGIVSVYGTARTWAPVVAYTEDLLSTWNGPNADEMRTLLDFFDLPISVLFGRCVDAIDASRQTEPAADCTYDILPGILEGLNLIYSREHFQSGASPFFEALKQRPDDYIHATPAKLIAYLRTLRQTKTTFLLTGSHIDFADFTASHALGADWRDLFDVVVSFAKKPGFFAQQRPFLRLAGMQETADTIEAADMRLGEVYSQGNYAELLQLLCSKRGAAKPKVLYVGDNLVQDVYAPFALSGCDSIAVVEELLAEGVRGADGARAHEAAGMLCSLSWGSYFGSACDPTLWSEVIQRNARLCVAEVTDLAEQPLDHEYRAFTLDQRSCSAGFWPAEPRHFNEN